MKPFTRLKPNLLALALCALTLPAAQAAAPAKDAYLPGNISISIEKDGTPLLTTPALDLPALQNRYVAQHKPGTPLRFAEAFTLDKNTTQVGSWGTQADGSRLWRLKLHTPSATSINLGFSRFHLPEGASLTLSAADGSQALRPFTAADNKPYAELWTPMVDGDSVLLELRLPAGTSADAYALELHSINAGFINPNNPSEWAHLKSGRCNVDVVCPQGDNWRDQIRAVGAYTIGGVDYCSGTLINNVRNDGTPYFLTANHCLRTQTTAQQVVIYWNYENSTCRTPGSAASGQPGDGQRNQFSTGTSLRATHAATDFTLLQVDNPIPASFEVYLAGFDARGNTPSSAVAIHHPQVEEKRISFENDPLTATSYNSSTPNSDGTHWRVADWDVGTTEQGSSGSALFSPEKRIIGQLHGGQASCSNDLPDWYGRVSKSWEGGGTNSSRLKNWLDPDNTGTRFQDGIDNNSEPVPPEEELIFADGFEQGGPAGCGQVIGDEVDSGPVNLVINDGDDMELNLVTCEFKPYSNNYTGSDINLHKSGDEGKFSLYVYGNLFPNGQTGAVEDANTSGQVAALRSGASVNPNSTFTTSGRNNMNAWVSGANAYIGIRFFNEQTGKVNYGYVKMETTGPTGYPARITRYVYNKTGAGITIP